MIGRSDTKAGTADTTGAIAGPVSEADEALVMSQDGEGLVMSQDGEGLVMSQDGEGLVMFLERDQLVVDKSRPVPRAALGGRARAALWALRGFAGVVSAMVLYTFVSQVAS